MNGPCGEDPASAYGPTAVSIPQGATSVTVSAPDTNPGTWRWGPGLWCGPSGGGAATITLPAYMSGGV